MTFQKNIQQGPAKSSNQLLNETMDEIKDKVVGEENPRGRKRKRSTPRREMSPSPVRRPHRFRSFHSSRSSSLESDRPLSMEREPSVSLEREDEEDTLNIPLYQQLAAIQLKFPEKVVPSVPESNKSSIIRPEMKEKDPCVSALPLHEVIKSKIDNMHLDLSEPSKFALKREEQKLPIGKFPRAWKINKRYNPTDYPDFNVGYKEDSNMDRLIPSFRLKTIHQEKCLDTEKSARVTADIKKGLANMSWSLWGNDTSNEILKDLIVKMKGNKAKVQEAINDLQMVLNLNCSALQSVKQSTDHFSSALSVLTLGQRDVYLSNMDRDLPRESKERLRTAPFNQSTLFAGTVADAADNLKDVKQTLVSQRPVTVRLEQERDNFRSYRDYNKKDDYKGKQQRGQGRNTRYNYRNEGYNRNSNRGNRGSGSYRGRGYNRNFTDNRSYENKGYEKKPYGQYKKQ